VKKLIAMLVVAGLLATTGFGCGGDTSKDKKDKKDGATTDKMKDGKTPPKDGG
jgi:hypothetical protein